jgi:DNA-binding NarL/FixJ family response regulator
MAESARSVVILCQGHQLADALASGLRSRDWRPQVAEVGAAPLYGERQPTLLVEDDVGRLPDAAVRTAVALAAAEHRLVIAVAGRVALADLVRVVAAGATAVNADQPYRCILAAVRETLKAGPLTWPQRERLLAALRQRAEEGERFRALTPGECAVMAGLAAGHSAESLAATRTVALATVRSQIAAVLRKLSVRSQAEAVALTYRSCVDQRVTEPLARFHQIYG